MHIPLPRAWSGWRVGCALAALVLGLAGTLQCRVEVLPDGPRAEAVLESADSDHARPLEPPDAGGLAGAPDVRPWRPVLPLSLASPAEPHLTLRPAVLSPRAPPLT